MIILVLFLGGITIAVLMITSAKMMVESKYEIRKEEERKQKEETERFFKEFDEDVELCMRMLEKHYLKKKKEEKRKILKNKKC